MRVILYTGKGGVGKTSIAAATAIKIASQGKKVLIMSTDQAHSLSDSFDRSLSNEPQSITENLDGMEIDVVEESEKAYGKLKAYLGRLFSSKSEGSLEVEELLVFPGFEELCSLIKVKEICDQGFYDVLIVDCAPTGETMSLLKFPEMLEGFVEKLLPIKRKAVNIAGPLIEKTTKIPMPDDSNFSEIEQLFHSLSELRELMENKEIMSIRIVTTPEKIVVKETKRNFAFLHLFDYNVDAIVVNKIYPKESLSGYFNKWIENQETGLKDIEESFRELPVFRMNLMKQELRTVEKLKIAADLLYEEDDPSKVLFKDTIFKLEEKEDHFIMKIKLPFLDKRELDLLQKGDELSIAIKNERRNFILPNKLKSKQIEQAKYESGWLNLYFI